MSSTFWRDRRVLVTGCNGFLGSWLTAKLIDAEADVVGLARVKGPNSQLLRPWPLEKLHLVEGDVADYALLERVLADYEINTIFHLAAQTIVTIANHAPLSTFETNIKGTWVVLEAARHSRTVTGVVVASSDKAYGSQDQLPNREDSPLLGRHPYDVSKSCADLIAQTYGKTYALPIVVTRCANLYGGGDLNWDRIVPGTIRSVLRAERPIIRSDGTFRRDYLYVEDAVSGYLDLAEQISQSDIHGTAFNFGMDEPTTALEMVKTILSLSNCQDLEPVILDQAQNEIPDQFLDSNKAHRLLGWYPRHTLRDGLQKTLDWYRRYLAGE